MKRVALIKTVFVLLSLTDEGASVIDFVGYSKSC